MSFATKGIIMGEVVALTFLTEMLKKKIALETNPKVTAYQSNKGDNSKKTWTITNLDDKLSFPISGEYGAESYEETVGSNFAEFNTLGRAAPITQFINTNADTVSFTAVLYAQHQVSLKLHFKDAITNLKKWSKFDKSVGRVPIISFKAGDGIGSINYAKAFITACNITATSYDRNGDLYHAQVALTIKEYTPYKHNVQSFDSRYHSVIDGETHELISAREYGNPMLGVVVRTYNDQDELSTGDIVKLPDKQSKSISTNLIKPKSLILGGLTDQKEYRKYLQSKDDDSPPHIVEILNSKIESRNIQYGNLI